MANEDNEGLLCHWALDASVSELEKLCNERRWHYTDGKNIKYSRKTENDRALLQWESRALRWDTANNGNTIISLSLPPQLAQAFLNCVEHSLEQFERTESNMAQRHADAAVLMAENSLQNVNSHTNINPPHRHTATPPHHTTVAEPSVPYYGKPDSICWSSAILNTSTIR